MWVHSNIKTYEEILKHVLDAGSNAVWYFGGAFNGGYHLQQVPEEISQFLFDHQNLTINNYLEIGVCQGGLTRLMCDILNIRNVHLMDLHINAYGCGADTPIVYNENMKVLKNSGYTTQFWGDSHTELADIWLDKFPKMDLIFIDGDHETEGVKQDTYLAEKFLQPNGVMAFHDSVTDGPVKVWIDQLKGGVISSLKFRRDYFTKLGISVFDHV